MSAALRFHESTDANDALTSKEPRPSFSAAGQTFRVLAFRSRQQKHTDGEALRIAISSAGLKLADVARAWGCHHSLVTEVCDGEKPLTPERTAQLPAKVRAALSRGVQLTLPGLR